MIKYELQCRKLFGKCCQLTEYVKLFHTFSPRSSISISEIQHITYILLRQLKA